MIARQIGHELFKLFARKRSYIGFGAFLLVQLTILALLELPKAKRAVSELLERNGLAFAEYYKGLTLAVVTIVFTFVLLGALYIALVAGDIVAKEVEDGTMRMVLSRPVSRLRLMVVKWIAAAIYTVSLVAFLGVTALLFASISKGGLGNLFVFIQEEGLFVFTDTGDGLFRYVRAIACLCYSTLTITSLAFMFSCFNMKPAAATILTLSFFFVDLVLRNMPFFKAYERWFVTHHTAFWARTFADYPDWPSILESVAYLAALSATFWMVGATRFCTRDFKA